MTHIAKVTKAGAALVHDTFRKSQESYLEFLTIAEQRALTVTPDFKVAWKNAFKLQRLLKEQQGLRFEYWFGRGDLDRVTCKSLDSIGERLDKGWTDEEEAGLKKNLGVYRDIAREIDDIKSKWDPTALNEPRPTLEQDRNIVRQGLLSQRELRNSEPGWPVKRASAGRESSRSSRHAGGLQVLVHHSQFL